MRRAEFDPSQGGELRVKSYELRVMSGEWRVFAEFSTGGFDNFF